MGGVELLSREGEIAIAKRIEAGKEVMLNALAQSPITARKIFSWHEQLQNDEILVREIIDIDTSYLDNDKGNESNTTSLKTEKKTSVKNKDKKKKKMKANYPKKLPKKMNLMFLWLQWKMKLNQWF